MRIIIKSCKLVILFCCLCSILSGCARRDRGDIILTPAAEVQADEGSVYISAPIEAAAVPAETISASPAEDIAIIPAEPVRIYVHICGAVMAEGVYQLEQGMRVIDAVEAAGGFTSEADASYVNLASVLADGMKITIPTTEETALSESGAETATQEPGIERSVAVGIAGEPLTADGSGDSDDGKVNINTATAAELCTLPGIGEARAQSIIAYRDSHGGFSRIEDIMQVNGIKEKSFAQLKDLIKV